MGRKEIRAAAKSKRGAMFKKQALTKFKGSAVFQAKINNHKTSEPKDHLSDLIYCQVIFKNIIDGVATRDQFDDLAIRLNSVRHRCVDIPGGALEIMNQCNAAMNSCCNRFLSTGKFGFTNPERLAVLQGMELMEEVVKNSSKAQMAKCWDKAVKVIEQSMQDRVKLGLPALPTPEHP